VSRTRTPHATIRALATMALALSVSCGSNRAGTQPDTSGPDGSGPTVPVPANLWKPAAGATPATGTYLYVEMDASFSPGVTYPRTILPASGIVTVTAASGAFSVTASDTVAKLDLRGAFTAMLGNPQVQDGYYPDLRGPADADPLRGSLDVTLNAHGCSGVTGWFVVDHIFYFNGHLTALDLRFEQRCPGFAAPMHGQLHWTENLT
jgi:hypothetical protein